MALQAAGSRARAADLYVTLEPCNHVGRTGPCTEAIVAAGIRRVFVGSRDPNPRVRGGGIERLRRAGLEVQAGILGGECDAANESWFKFITTRTPWVIAKAAATLDGKIATRTGESKWITSEPARERVHLWRDEVDAVLVGVGTVLADDPRLTARPREHRHGPPRDPLRVVLDSRLRLPLNARVLPGALVAHVVGAPPRRAKALLAAGAELVECRAGRDGRVDVRDLLKKLAARNVVTVMAEGGAKVHGAFLAAGAWDELRLFQAPRVLGEGALGWAGLPAPARMAGALAADGLSAEQVGPDVLLQARKKR
jgi:diaminohydroxyphosphoribosylaminopyrimidine deaminase/5-amino-6-(5-phosphoribosylamino)uracil reductase